MTGRVTPDEVRRLAAEMVRTLAGDARGARDAQRVADSERGRVALAAVEALETLGEIVEASMDGLPAGPAAAFQLALRGAWERLEAAGIRRDGAVGEAVDLTRHRVVARRPGNGQPPGTVCEVVEHGIVIDGRRLREAAVCMVEGMDAARRD